MYTELAEIPVPASGQFITSDVIEVTYSVRDHVRNAKRTMSKTIVLSDSSSTSSHLHDISDIVLSVLSPSRKKRAILREIKSDSQSKRIVEIWDYDRVENSMDVTEKHGAFYADEYFASLAFSKSESSIIYTAEEKVEDSGDPYARFRFRPVLGEGLAGKKRPTTFLYSWSTTPDNESDSKPQLLSIKPNNVNVLFGQAIFSPNSDNILYATGYEYTSDGRFLGIKGCYNRPFGIWQVLLESASKAKPDTLEMKTKKITPSHLSCRSPRVYIRTSGKFTLLWLASPSGGAHISGASLYSLDIPQDDELGFKVSNNGKDPLVNTVRDPQAGEFPGLYPVYNFVTTPVTSFGNSATPSIILHSIWGSRSTILSVSTDSGSVRDLTPNDNIPEKIFSWGLLATDGKSRILCQRSTTDVPYEIVLGELDDNGGVSWRVIDRPSLSDQVQTALSYLTTRIIQVPGRGPTETIIIQCSASSISSEIPPCITVPHGGPHGTTTTAFSASTVALVLAGYTVSLPNYRGSPGFGEDALQALIGQCGNLDVNDCIESVRHLINLGIAQEGPGKLFIMGGSHGGFLTAHLIGQFPDMFSAAVMRNPVISAGEISTTDIPDWYFSEFGLNYSISSSKSEVFRDNVHPTRAPLITPEVFVKLHQVSPMAHVEAVRVPVLLLIGGVDQRVSPTQGKDYYHALKGLRVVGKGDAKVEMLIFDSDSHPLDSVEASKVGFEAGVDWFEENVKRASS
ncbi:Alpha/Beta hydrolase protein [Crucibulum laeve]|uniref:acylaminoacyl-peptidase n=1 Tax=Crucibulum laeve TaxID=68775 RepID=A0A5C3LJI4_9AGAR|nr:Alpha/Beta hydrolase protein [Crucibulum laeve]